MAGAFLIGRGPDGDDIPVAVTEEGAIEVSGTTTGGAQTSLPATPTTASITSGTSSALLLAQNSNRKGFSVSNISTSVLYMSFSNPATVANCFIEVPPKAFLMFDQDLIVANAIYGIWASANGAAQVTEYV
jgi:hypothetical protein